VVPSVVDDGIEDLVAHGFRSRRPLTRLGVATALGRDEIDAAREHRATLLVFDNVLTWLRGQTLGAVIIDWRRAGALLEGVRTLACSPALAPQLHRATRRCWPRPIVAIPAATSERRRAA
jgi:hypothetical protein